MSLEGLEEPWGQLVSTERPKEEEEERTPLLGPQFQIGRDKDADLVIPNNKFVSTRHCLLLRDEEGRKWVKDTSTNGTLLNGKRLEKNKEVKLADGDIIRIVFRKEKSDYNVTYRFQDLCPSTEAVEEEEEEEATLELTHEYDTVEEEEEDKAKDTKAVGRKHPLKVEDAPPSKRPSLAPRADTALSEKPPTKATAEPGEGKAAEDRPEKEKVQKKAEAGGRPPEGEPAKPAVAKADSIEETLICQICQEIFHDCISLQPCMHSYCAGCYSDWMSHSNKCPACRNKVERISKNHLVNNLVEAFLRANPSRKRPEEDLKELDEKNKITKDMLYPRRGRRRDADYSDTSSEDEDTSTDSSSDDGAHPFHVGIGVPSIFPFPPPPAPLYLCRQCPGFFGVRLHPSHPPPPPFTCSPSTNHVLCMCCLQPMPDHRHSSDLTIPPQKCDICGKAFCHMYWGCNKHGCTGCLGLFKDMEFNDSTYSVLINDNKHESAVLKDYLQSQHLTMKDIIQECCAKLDSGEYTCCDSRTHRISSDTRTCFQCALRNLKDLAYYYRRDIPSDELPDSVTRRADCHWGKNCRTQKHNQDHARRYNHICEQTRMS